MREKACQQANHLAKTKDKIGAPMKALLATTAQPILLEVDHSNFEQFNEHCKNIFAIVNPLSTITNRLGRVIMKLNNSLTIGAGSPSRQG